LDGSANDQHFHGDSCRAKGAANEESYNGNEKDGFRPQMSLTLLHIGIDAPSASMEAAPTQT
jgi:hypothetical protein